MLPQIDKLIEALDEPNLDNAQRLSDQLDIETHRQFQTSVKEQFAAAPPDPTGYHHYLELVRQLDDSLRNGDIPSAVTHAGEVQKAQEALSSHRSIAPMAAPPTTSMMRSAERLSSAKTISRRATTC